MEQKIVSMEALLIAGMSGAGDETAKVWENYMRLEKLSPLKNTVGTSGYEIRLYPAGLGPGTVHVGMVVQDEQVPGEYTVLALPATEYVEFEINPSKGYESSNEDIEKWLYDNSDTWKQRMLDGNSYGIEVYDERFTGNNEAGSIVGMLVPIESVEVSEEA